MGHRPLDKAIATAVMPLDLKKELEEYAEKTGKSMSSIIVEALKLLFRNKKCG